MDNEEEMESCKVVLLGESGVGKTSLINQFIDESFTEEEKPSSGATFSTKEVSCLNGEKTIKLEIWDTAGQEKYRALSKMFYKDAGAAILVYDITRKESFEQIKEYWTLQIKEYSPKKIILALAANKSDLFDIHEEVDEKTGRDLAKEIGALFFSTSAKNSSGVADLFKAIGDKFCNPNWTGDPEAEKAMKEYQEIKRGSVRIQKPSAKEEEEKKKEKKGCC